MSKSLGNFYTLRDLLAKGYSAASIRYLLSTTPHRKQLNFTFDGLKGAQAAIERLRNFKRRLETEQFPEGPSAVGAERATQAIREFETGLDDDLNTAQAVAAVFEYVRDVNSAIDTGEFRQEDAAEAGRVLSVFDSIFDVLNPDQETPGVTDGGPAGSARPSAEEIEALIAKRAEARKTRNFALADQIRDELQAKGVVLEDTRASVSWRYADS